MAQEWRFRQTANDAGQSRGELPSAFEVATADRDADDARLRSDLRLHARPVRQPRVDHRADFIHAPANAADDALDDPQHVLIIGNDDVGQFQPVSSLCGSQSIGAA